MEPVRDALVIGTTKLRAIREEIEKAFASTGEDPIERLERQISSVQKQGDRTEVLEGLKRFLESPGKPSGNRRGECGDRQKTKSNCKVQKSKWKRSSVEGRCDPGWLSHRIALRRRQDG
jgi:hypothetical protein